jgi:hypothetical protein
MGLVAALTASTIPAFARRVQGASGELAAILALCTGTDLISLADEATIDEGLSRLGRLVRSALENR